MMLELIRAGGLRPESEQLFDFRDGILLLKFCSSDMKRSSHDISVKQLAFCSPGNS